jgi:PAS domain S-box-containing protein
MAARHDDHIVKLVDDEGIILYASPSHRRLGYDPQDLVGRSLNELIARDDIAHSSLAITHAVLTHEALEVGLRHVAADGSLVSLRRHTRALPGDALSSYYIITTASLTAI